MLTTPRLLLRTFRHRDLEPFAALNADPEVVRFLGGVPLDRAESDSIAQYAQECHATGGLAMQAVERRADGAFLGMCGLGRERWYPDDVEVGWRLAREHWGQGYATEAASAWLRHAFGPLGLPRVISITDADPPNLRSIAVMRRLGMTVDHEAELEDEHGRFRAVIHSITPDQWAAREEATRS